MCTTLVGTVIRFRIFQETRAIQGPFEIESDFLA
jgi:hypothetical protein